jgi:ribosomal protein S18 acetylase RimI-like enzyme
VSEHRALLERILRFKADHVVAAVEARWPVPGVGGALLLTTPSLPDVWELNVVLAEPPADADAADRLLAATDFHQAPTDAAHRALRLTGPAADGVLGHATRRGGWWLDRLLVMTRTRPPEAAPGPLRPLVEPDPAELAHAEDAAAAAGPFGADAAVRAQLVAQHERWEAAAPWAHTHGVLDEAGRLVGWCRVYDDGALCELDDVNVLPGERGRGHGRALLEAVLAAIPAGRQVFLCADPDDRPRRLYERLGFEVVGERLGATRPPGAG